MAIDGLPLSDVHYVGNLIMWEKFYFPVYEIKQVQSDADFINLVNNVTAYRYGNANDETVLTKFSYGMARSNLDLSISAQRQVKDTLINFDDVVDFADVPGIGTAKLHREGIWASTTKEAVGYGYFKISESGYSNNLYQYTYRERGIGTSSFTFEYDFYNSNGTGAGFIRWRESGETHYARVFIRILYNPSLPTPEQYGSFAVTIWNKPTESLSHRYEKFFGCQESTIVTSFTNNAVFSDEDVPPYNPFEPGGPSGPTDPDLPPGTFDGESDPIPDSPLPTISSANTGFTRIYNPTLSQVQDLARYLWTDETVLETIWNHIKQFFENPMEAIIGFNLVPVPVPDGGTKNFALMYIDTGVQMTVAANQFVDQDCGSLKLERYYGSALDQSPYTKVSCFLPFIGTVQLNTDEVMGTTLSIKYRVDICSGSCVAKIFVDGNCLYQYSGHCAIPIPISAADFSSYVSSAISVAKLAIGAATAGAAGLAAAGATEAAQQTNQVVTTTQETMTARNPSTGRQITTGTRTVVETREAPADQSGTQASFSGMAPQNIANTVGQIMSSKPHVEHSGSFSGNTGYLGVRRPFLIIERPNMCMPASYQSMNGFPAMITMELGTCKGFTQVQQVQLTGMSATNPEQAEIMQLLKMGVII